MTDAIEYCRECQERPVDTKDGSRLCVKCLRKLLKEQNAYVKPAIHERRGRPSIPTQVTGGTVDMRNTAQLDRESE